MIVTQTIALTEAELVSDSKSFSRGPETDGTVKRWGAMPHNNIVL
jgi:hypothetical protein